MDRTTASLIVLCSLLVVSLPAGIVALSVPAAAVSADTDSIIVHSEHQAIATQGATFSVQAPDDVEVGEEFEVTISSTNWETSNQGNSETYEPDPCYGPGIDLDETPDLVYTTTNVDVVSGDSDWDYVGGVVGYEWTATAQAVDDGDGRIQFAVICDDGSREAEPVEFEIVGGDGDSDSGEDDDDAITITPPDGSPIDDDDDDQDEVSDDDDEEDDEGLLDAIREGVTDGFSDATDTIIDAITGALFDPFLELLHELVSGVALVLTWTPTVDPNPAVEDVHDTALKVAILVALLGFMAAGLLYQVGPVLGISYAEVRWILPRLIVALIFATISLPILQLFVDLTNAFTYAFQPADYDNILPQMAGTGVALVLVWVINAFLLVLVLAVYLVRGAYILFGAAIAPLIAVFWAIPRTRRYAAVFISTWFAMLAMGPLAMVILHFSYALMQADGATGGQAVSNWMFGVAAFALLLFIPKLLLGAAASIALQGAAMGGRVGYGARQKYRKYSGGGNEPPDKLQDMDYLETMEMRELQRQRRSRENRYADIDFDYPGGDARNDRAGDRRGGRP